MSSANKPSISLAPNGPYLVKDLNRLTNQQGSIETTKSMIALCRCGESANKPETSLFEELAPSDSQSQATRRQPASQGPSPGATDTTDV